MGKRVLILGSVLFLALAASQAAAFFHTLKKVAIPGAKEIGIVLMHGADGMLEAEKPGVK